MSKHQATRLSTVSPYANANADRVSSIIFGEQLLSNNRRQAPRNGFGLLPSAALLHRMVFVGRDTFAPMRMTFVHFVALLVWLLPAHLCAQAISIIPGQETHKISPAEPMPAAQDLRSPQAAAAEEKHPRLFWIMPTYAVSNNKSPVPLSSREKCRLFLKNTTDPYTIGYAAFQAGIQQANNDLPEYGQGAAGYGKRFGAGLADETSAGFFQAYLFASLLRQDPRYFRQGSGPFKNRLAHAIIRPMVTRKDSGGRTFNWSGLLGGIAASSLANVYYPATDRGVAPTFQRVATGIPFSILDHLIDEFGPDLQKMVTPRK